MLSSFLEFSKKVDILEIIAEELREKMGYRILGPYESHYFVDCWQIISYIVVDNLDSHYVKVRLYQDSLIVSLYSVDPKNPHVSGLKPSHKRILDLNDPNIDVVEEIKKLL